MSKCPIYRKLINSQRWRKLRFEKLKNNPLCECCEQNGLTVPTTEIHHIIPIESAITQAQMETLCFDYSNLQSLCHDCHVKAHIDLKSKSKANQKANNERKTALFVERFLS